MKLRAIITGSTGMIGKGLLLECLDDDRVETILLINRSSVGIKHRKVKELIHADFFDLTSIREHLKGYTICYFCLGVSAVGMKEQQYSRITHDLTLRFAGSLLSMIPDLTFCYISGAGTDSSEKGRTMWARVKGKTENDLMALPFKKSYMLRPAFIQPKRGIRSRTPAYNLLYSLLKPFYPLLKNLKKYVTSSDRLGKSMIELGIKGYSKKILENNDLLKLIE